MTSNSIPALFILTLLLFFSTSSQALNCGNPVGAAETTVCSTPQLVWLNELYNEAFRQRVTQDPKHADSLLIRMHHQRDACSDRQCLLGAYLFMIGHLYGSDQAFDWEGQWWNMSAPAGHSGKILISDQNLLSLRMDATVEAGAYQSQLSGEVRDFSGVGLVDKIAWGGDCTVVMIPMKDGRLKVDSDTAGTCSLLLPGNMSLDGIYVKGTRDPRPPATLYSIGIFSDRETDERFRTLVGTDYAQYLATATAFSRGVDLDNRGATVVMLWFKGRANRQAAIIMTTPQGKIWAMRVEPGAGNQGTVTHYVTTESDKKTLPKTLVNWQAIFNNQ